MFLLDNVSLTSSSIVSSFWFGTISFLTDAWESSCSSFNYLTAVAVIVGHCCDFLFYNRCLETHLFPLQGSCEAAARSFGCLGGFLEDEERREHCESTFDFVTHIFCHPCALCQEGREVRRRLPHPGFSAKPVRFMLPPGDQTMGR